MAVVLPSEQSNTPLSLAQAEAIFKAIFRASESVTIISDVLTVPGSGRYKVLPQSGISDQITSIVLTGEAIEGTLIQLRPQTAGHTLTLVHGSTLKLANEQDAVLPTPYSTIWVRHYGSGIFVAESTVLYTS